MTPAGPGASPAAGSNDSRCCAQPQRYCTRPRHACGGARSALPPPPPPPPPTHSFQVLNMRQPLQFVYMRGSWLNSNDLVAQTPNITFRCAWVHARGREEIENTARVRLCVCARVGGWVGVPRQHRSRAERFHAMREAARVSPCRVSAPPGVASLPLALSPPPLFNTQPHPPTARGPAALPTPPCTSAWQPPQAPARCEPRGPPTPSPPGPPCGGALAPGITVVPLPVPLGPTPAQTCAARPPPLLGEACWVAGDTATHHVACAAECHAVSCSLMLLPL